MNKRRILFQGGPKHGEVQIFPDDVVEFEVSSYVRFSFEQGEFASYYTSKYTLLTNLTNGKPMPISKDLYVAFHEGTTRDQSGAVSMYSEQYPFTPEECND